MYLSDSLVFPYTAKALKFLEGAGGAHAFTPATPVQIRPGTLEKSGGQAERPGLFFACEGILRKTREDLVYIRTGI